ncbi:MAG: NAD(+) diphosphatase [Sphingobium sp.]
MHGKSSKGAPLPGFVGGTIDRADEIRSNPDAVKRSFASPDACRIMLEGLTPRLEGDRLMLEPLPSDARLADHVLLGVDDGGPVFVQLARTLPSAAIPMPALWELIGTLPANEMALYGTARSLLDWHVRHGFCAACGQPTLPEKAGWARRCGGCNTEHFPRVDPVSIMLAEKDGKVLLGRQHRWPAGRYSALAGFIEPGETIEEAVARELKEEAGITVHSVRYLLSQPWPFPSSLMIGCIGLTDSDELTLDQTEIEDAIWVDAQGVRASLLGLSDAPFIAPPPMAVAWHLLQLWLDEQGVSLD